MNSNITSGIGPFINFHVNYTKHNVTIPTHDRTSSARNHRYRYSAFISFRVSPCILMDLRPPLTSGR